jgi:hypothetical protein
LGLRDERELVDDVVIHVVEDADVTKRRARLLDDLDRQLVESVAGE